MSLTVLADHLASKGRNGDSMLVHMTPEEVKGLHALALAHGGELTINPETGLPEANFLKKMLPTILGAAFTYFTGLPPEIVGLGIGAVETARTGDLGKGIAAGLGAYGGANLTSALTSAGTEAIGAQALSEAGQQGVLERAALMGGEQGLSTVALTEPAAREAIAREAIAKASPFDKFSTGISGLMEKEGRDAFMKEIGGLKGLSRAGLGILAGSSLAADKSVQANLPQTVTKFAVRDFDPYGGYFTTRPTMYGASGGLMGMAEGGVVMPPGSTSSYQRTNMSPGMLDFAQRSEPVVRMAGGGMTPEEQVRQAYATIGRQGVGNLVSQIDQGGFDFWKNQLEKGVIKPEDFQTKFMGAVNQYIAEKPTDPVSQYVRNYMNNPAAMTAGTAPATVATTGAAVNPYAREIAEGSKAIPYAKGTRATDDELRQIYKELLGREADPGGFEFYKASQWSPEQIRAEIMNSPEYKTRPVKPVEVTSTPFVPDTSADVTPGTVFGGDTTTPTYTASQPQVTLGPAFQPTAPTMSQVRTGYEQGGGSTTMPTITDTKPTDRTYTYNEAFGLLKGFLQQNPNAQYQDVVGFARSRGIPDMQARAAYNEFRFSSMSGGTQDAYDYLMGRGKYPIKPYSPTGELMRPYAESVLGVPENRKAKKLIFDPETRTYKPNPDYVPRKSAVETAPIRDVTGKPVSMSSVTEAYFRANPDVQAAWQAGNTGMSADDYAVFHWNTFGQKEGRKGWTGATPGVGGGSSGGGGSGGGGSGDTDTIVPAAKGGLMDIAAAAAARGGNVPGFDLGSYSDGGRLLRGPGDGVSDSIPATIGGKRPARLADGEFVVPARIVSEIGNGSTEAGARKLYAMMDRVQRARAKTTGKGKVAKNTNAEKYLPA